MTYDDWKTTPPDEDEPREVPEPDWDAIREAREDAKRESREEARQYLREAAWADTHSSDVEPKGGF